MASKFNDKEWKRFLSRLNRRLRDKTNLLRTAASTAGIKDIQEHFRREAGPEGKWKPRSPRTQYQYAHRKSATYSPANKLLQLTGNLRNSILPKNIKRVSNNAIMIFSNLVYSGKHDRGDRKRNIPQRKFMWFSKNAMKRMMTIIMKMAAENGI